MGKSSFLKILSTIVVSVALGLTSEPLLAQRGGHGGGGGFHGGGYGGGFHGGGGGFHGGGGYSGFHGGGFSGYRGGGYGGGARYYSGGPHYGYRNGISHGGYYGGGYSGAGYYGRGYYGHGYYGRGYYGWGGGWGGWGWGYPGWGISIGFNFGPFWGGYAYPYYAYSPWWYAPYPYYYPYPYYVPVAPVAYGGSNNEPTDSDPADYVQASGPTSQQLAETAIRQMPQARPEVRNAIRALSGMPPAARERELATGLYANFSPQERQVVKNAVFRPSPNNNSKVVVRTAVEPPAQARPELQDAVRALRAMPPAARERQIDSGMYSTFTPEEREMLRTVAQVQPGM